MNEIETFYGLVENTLDALRIFQMCRDGRLQRVRRRLHERERRLIRSGSVFVFDEEESGIRRWTDGRLWSPSRILGNFLIYRELEKKGHRSGKGGTKRPASTHQSSQMKITQFINHHIPQGTKVPKILPKAAAESLDMLWGIPRGIEQGDSDDFNDWIQNQSNQLDNEKGINPQELQSPPSISASHHRKSSQQPQVDPTSGESLRVLKSKKLSNNHKGRYIFKADGLIKKTISIQLEGHTHHLVAYYSLEDFCKGHLQLNEALNEGTLTEETEPNLLSSDISNNNNNPSNNRPPFDPQLMEILRQVPIPVDLMLQQNFRKPAALLASATSNAQNLIAAAGDPECGEKLITALEYGAINPSDLQNSNSNNNNNNNNNNQPQYKKTSTFVPGGGIIFSSSPTSHVISEIPIPSTRPRRHSSFHPMQQQQQVKDRLQATSEADIIDSLNILDESSQLSGEALEFLSHFSDEQEQQESFNFLPPPQQSQTSQEFAGDLETELFGSILSSSDNPQDDTDKNIAIRGHDVLLSDTIK